MPGDALYIGIDLGTSACRACAITATGDIAGQSAASLPATRRQGALVEQDPHVWWQALCVALQELLARIEPAKVRAIAVDGTSGTLLVTDRNGNPLAPALMYNDARSVAQAAEIARYAPPASAAHGATSGLAKLLYLQAHYPAARHALNQADWINGKLTGTYGVSDEHNCLKLGYDTLQGCWPDWLAHLQVRRDLLPEVVPAGTPLATLSATMAQAFNLPGHTRIIAGTTDSTAAFIATGARQTGEAVTSLGSTLVMKVITEQPLFAPHYGIYSHRFANFWLAGGGSNSGGAVLRHYFSTQQLNLMTPLLQPERLTGLDYYPLLVAGERFPVNDPLLEPRLTPRPADDVIFFQGLLEGMARIEQRGYQTLARCGAPYPASVRSAGGGAFNEAWKKIRERLVQAPMIDALHTEAAYGAALLAQRALG